MTVDKFPILMIEIIKNHAGKEVIIYTKGGKSFSGRLSIENEEILSMIILAPTDSYEVKRYGDLFFEASEVIGIREKKVVPKTMNTYDDGEECSKDEA